MAQEHQAPQEADCGIKMIVVAEQLKSMLWVASAMAQRPADKLVPSRRKWQESGKRANQKIQKNGHPPPSAVFKKLVN